MDVKDLSLLIEKVRSRIDELAADGPPPFGIDAASLEHPPLAEPVIDSAERRLGFALPPALRALYARVGNGGYGPGYGLLGLVGGAVQEEELDAVGVYERDRRPADGDPHWEWPKKLLPVIHLGCAMFFCVDCSDERGDVVWFEPNPHEAGEPWDDAFLPLGLPFEELMLRWADGEDLDALMEAAEP